MKAERRKRKAPSLHAKLLVSMLLLCMVLLFLLSWHFLSNYEVSIREECREQVKELCLEFSNRIQTTGYLTNQAQTSLEAEMDMAAQIYHGRIMVIDAELRVIEDTFELEEGKYMVSEEVVKAMKGRMRTYIYDYGNVSEIICQVREEASNQVMGCVVFSFSKTEQNRVLGDMLQNSILICCVLLVLSLCVILLISARLVFPLKKLAFHLNQTGDNLIKEEKLAVTGNREVENIVTSINELADDLRDTERRRQEFVSNVSHELKTPLTAMKVLADSLVNQQGLPEELYQEFLVDINQEIDRENRIIQNLLTMVRQEKKNAEMMVAEENINELIEGVMRRLRPLAKLRNIEMIFESYRTVTAEVDELKMSQALTNLVENAIKYNVDGGKVKVSLNADHRYFYIKVEDTGIGIPEASKKFIFDRFYRVDKARSRETGGTGLGLAITKNAVLMHHGNIKVSGKEGAGAVFVMRIPLSFVKETPEQEP